MYRVLVTVHADGYLNGNLWATVPQRPPGGQAAGRTIDTWNDRDQVSGEASNTHVSEACSVDEPVAQSTESTIAGNDRWTGIRWLDRRWRWRHSERPTNDVVSG